MKESIIDKYLEKKAEKEIYPDFENMLDTILENYDLSIFERIVYTFSRDGKIIGDMKIVELDHLCLNLVKDLVGRFRGGIKPIDYSNYSEISDFVNKHAKKEVVNEPTIIIGDKIHNIHFDNIDNFNNYLSDILKNSF